MTKIGITGGIGSGKSLVCQVFSRLGVPVYSADEAAKLLMDNDPEIRKELVAVFGKNIYAGRRIDRPAMARLIFANPGLLAQVNRVVHPRVGVDFQKWCASHSGEQMVILESAILFESNLFQIFDYVILVTAPEEVRRKRILDRPGMTPEIIQRIMKNQLPEKEKILRSRIVLNNDGNNLILPPILSLFTELMHKDKSEWQA